MCRSPTSTSAGLALICCLVVLSCSREPATTPTANPRLSQPADNDAGAPRQRVSLFSRGADAAVGRAAVEVGWRPPACGVAICDDYLRKYYRCYSGRVQGIQARMLRSSLDTMSMAWRRAARSARGRVSLIASCRDLLRKARAGSPPSCRW